MFRLFKKLRSKALLENKVVRYLMYIIGEILLVVIGILIALKVSQSAQENEQEELERRLISAIKDDIIHDVSVHSVDLHYYYSKDSLINLVLNDSLTKSDYLENPSLFNLPLYYNGIRSNSLGIKNLETYQKQLDLKYENALSIINEYYYSDIEDVKEYSRKISDQIEDRWEKWLTNYTWFQLGVNSEKKFDYYLNSPDYKGEVKLFETLAIKNLMRMLNRQNLRGYDCILSIDESLKIPFASTMQSISKIDTLFNQLDIKKDLEIDVENQLNSFHYVHIIVNNDSNEQLYIHAKSPTGQDFPIRMRPDGFDANSKSTVRIKAGRDFFVKDKSGKTLGRFKTGFNDGFVVLK